MDEHAFSRCRRCRRRNARSRWRAIAGRPIRFAIRIDWVRTHDSTKFLESFYFQYGHASIADLGHVVLCFEGISELAATEIEDEQLWDGQARSSRYQDFSKSGFVIPPEFDAAQAAVYQQAAGELLAGYNEIHAKVFDHLAEKLPRPEAMSPQAYQRNVKARAFDVARYLLCFGIPTGVGQVTSIRTLERQVRRLKASEYEELRSLADEIAEACAAEPCLRWDSSGRGGIGEAVAPTLARHLDADEHLRRSREDLRAWASQNLDMTTCGVERHPSTDVDLIKPSDTMADIVATLALSGDGLALSAALRDGVFLERGAKERGDRRRACSPEPGAMNCCEISGARLMFSISSWTSAPIAIFTGTGAASSSGRVTRPSSAFETPDADCGGGFERDLRAACYHERVTWRRLCPLLAVIICFLSPRARVFSSRWILRRPNTSRGCVPE